ncbi:IclR family transcriptional regulator [Virgibacillus ainsalahensis]
MTGQNQKKNTLSSVTNAMRILRLFNRKQMELSFTDITRQTDLPKGTAHRLISSLVKEGFISKNPRTNHYRLGLSILSLGGAVYSHNELYKEALPVVKKVSETLDESAHLCLMENEKVVYLFRVESRHPERLVTEIGRMNPIHCTSEGLCILAFQEAEYIEDFLRQDFHAYTSHTVTEREKLLDILSDIRKKDYCILESSYYEGYISIAAPIRNHNGEVTASLSIIGNSKRIRNAQKEDVISKIKEGAQRISEHLGYFDI